MAWDGFGAEGKRFICQGLVFGAWDHGACVLLAAPAAPAGGASGLAGGTAAAIGGDSAGVKGVGTPYQPAADHQGRDSGDHGCR